jgi:hypothetical protein
MSQIRKAVFGALAISLTSGALQLASGHDLIGSRQVTTNAPQTGINRAAKADRGAIPSAAGQTRTIALRFDSLADTSVLVRLPLAKEVGKQARDEARNRPAAPAMKGSGDRKTAVACEPPVSVLTEVAKLLQPGRCVT